MTQKRSRNGNGANGIPHVPHVQGLSRGATYRLNPHLAYEMELHSLAKSREKKEILEQALERLFERDPIPKKLRAAAELILQERWKG